MPTFERLVEFTAYRKTCGPCEYRRQPNSDTNWRWQCEFPGELNLLHWPILETDKAGRLLRTPECLERARRVGEA